MINKITTNFLYVIKKLITRYGEHSVSAYSAQMAFFLMLSIFPFFIFLFTILGRFSIDSGIFVQFLESFFPKEVQKVILNFINDYVLVRDNSIISASIIGTILSASKGIRALMISLNMAYNIRESRKFIVVKLLDMIYTVLIVFGIVIILALPNIGIEMYNFINKYISIKWELFELYSQIKTIILPLTLIVLMSLIYMYVPNVKLKLKDVIWGTLFSIIGWSFMSYFFTMFINDFSNYKVIYGSLATVIILMFWLYFSSMILIVGGEINSIIKEKNEI